MIQENPGMQFLIAEIKGKTKLLKVPRATLKLDIWISCILTEIKGS